MKTDNSTTDTHRTQPRAIPRPPSSSEKSELLSFLLDNIASRKYGLDEEEVVNARALIDSAYIAVYDHYATECTSGYAGKLMPVVWPTHPTDHEVFVWRNGLLQESGGYASGSE